MKEQYYKHPHLSESGNTVVFVFLIISFFALAVETIFLQNQSTANTGGLAVQKQKIAYLAEGVTQIVNRFSQDYLASDTSPTTDKLSAYVTSRISNLNIAPYVLDNLTLSMGTSQYGSIPSGPFYDMDSYQTPVQMDVKLRDSTSTVYGEITKTSVLAKVTLFQFSLFGDLPGARSYLAPGLAMNVQGRVHINGDFCMGNDGSTATPLNVQRATVSGGMYNLRDPICWSSTIPVDNDTQVSTDSNFSVFSTLIPGATHGCTNCNGTGLGWRVYAQTVWKGNLLDSDHQVPTLRLSLNGADTVQGGLLADGTSISNSGSLKLLVDPVIPQDTVDTKASKFSSNSDIRIINGVWYLKNPSSPADWPGVPIWSDHPGRFTTLNEEGIEGTTPVGQDDIRDRWAGSANAWPLGSMPQNFSYYPYNTSAKALNNTLGAVISYGTLFRSSTSPFHWGPGQWVSSGNSSFCDRGFTCTNCSPNLILDALAPNSIQCSGGTPPIQSEFILNSARSGFRDGTIAVSSIDLPTGIKRSRIFPTNFDVSGFQNALANTAPGELGSYFGTHRWMGRSFNGIIYLSQTWLGSMAGLGTSGLPADYPYQGSVSDPNQVTASHQTEQQALPYELCSSSNSLVSGGLAGQTFSGSKARFTIPDCAKYALGYVGVDAITARPNVFRIINGSKIDSTLLTTGLTIATNLPVYIVGDYNTSSNTTSSTATPWIPVLVASDQTMLLSNSWDDANSRWDVPVSSLSRIATNTTYNLSLLSGGMGTTATNWSGGLENLARFLEKWNTGGTTAAANVNGSLVMGFSSSYFHNAVGPSIPVAWGNITYLPPQRNYLFDDHLKKYTNQPPGSPTFDIYAVLNWTSQ